jgi:hypothetical protein
LRVQRALERLDAAREPADLGQQRRDDVSVASMGPKPPFAQFVVVLRPASDRSRNRDNWAEIGRRNG